MATFKYLKLPLNTLAQWPLLGLAIILMLAYLPLILFGGVIVDDWGAIQSGLGCTKQNVSFWDCLGTHFPLWSNRPLAPVLITIFTLSFGTFFTGYLIANSIIYISAVLITALVFKRIIGTPAAIIFACLASFPEIAMPIIVSPVVQMTATASYLYWAISLYFICQSTKTTSKIAYLLGYLFLMFSFFTYEVILPLLTLSITLPYFYRNQHKRFGFIQYGLKFLTPVLAILAATLAWQKVVAPKLFPAVYSRLSFNPDPNRIIDIFNVWTGVFLVQIPALIKKIPNHIHFLEIISTLIFVVILAAVIWGRKKEVLQKGQLLFLLIAAICFLSSSLIFILSGGGIDISGYISRGLSSSWFSLSVLIAAIASILLSFGKIANLIGGSMIVCLTAINFSAFAIGRDNYIDSWKTQIQIVQDIMSQMKSKKLNQITVIGDVPNVVQNHFNGEVVFSAPWDFGAALAIFSNGAGSGTVIDSRGRNYHSLEFKDATVLLDGYWEGGYQNMWLYDFDPQKKSGVLMKMNGATDLKNHLNSRGTVYVGTPSFLNLSPSEKLDFAKPWTENAMIPSDEWGSMEDWGRWSLGTSAHLYLPPINYLASKAVIQARAFVSPKHPILHLEVSVNNNPAQKFALTKFTNNTLEIALPQNRPIKTPLSIQFKIIDPQSPKDVGISTDDDRKLGIGLVNLELVQ